MKIKINLTDYNFTRDIENRILISQLSQYEVQVIREIIDGSLKIPLAQLAEALEAEEIELLPILEKLSHTKLFEQIAHTITVNKEMRKFYEVQMAKFEEDFTPGIDFLQNLLSSVPIHVLPIWYAISRISDNIFHSILEKTFYTPKTYEKYLQEMELEDAILSSIVQDVFSAEDFIVEADLIQEKYALSLEELEKMMLLLEFNLVCCLSYRKKGNGWQKVISPFHEWREYLCFLRDTKPPSITDTEAILRETSPYEPADVNFTEKDVREIERSLKTIAGLGWIYLDDYLDWRVVSLENAEPICLKNKGKRWKYHLPSYSKEEMDRIKAILFGRLVTKGLVVWGTHLGQPCFSVQF